MNRFQDQIAIVTGGARGIGKGIAVRLLEEGARVVLCDILKAPLDETIEELAKIGPIVGKCINITEEKEVKAAIQEVHQMHGGIDILVNCAGIVGPTSTNITEYELKDFQHILNVNLVGAFICTKLVLPVMLERSYGRILHITSIAGKEGNPGMVGYASSKAGMMGLIKGIGKEYADQGITVNGIAPAVIATPMNLETDKDMLEYMTAKIPMNRLGTVEEVASLACWIISKEASFNTGCIFDLSGGRATY